MNLLGTARALDDSMLVWRVQGACLQYAAANAIAAPAGNQKNYGLSVLLRPQDVDVSMIGFVVSDEIISNKIVVDEQGAVDSSAVDDEDIVRVVSDKWDEVATKYPKNPLAPTAPVA